MCMYLMQIWNAINGEIIKGNFERRQKKYSDSIALSQSWRDNWKKFQFWN